MRGQGIQEDRCLSSIGYAAGNEDAPDLVSLRHCLHDAACIDEILVGYEFAHPYEGTTMCDAAEKSFPLMRLNVRSSDVWIS